MMKDKVMFFGRVRELNELNDTLLRDNVFCSVIGRRGVGKTRLMNYFLDNLGDEYLKLGFCGDSLASSKNQINGFLNVLYKNNLIKQKDLDTALLFGEWNSVFGVFYDALVKILPHKQVVIFIDEFAWFHKKGSNFLGAFSAFWNNVMSLKGVYVYISGSSLTWLDKNVVNTKGGLHGRVEKKIHLQPFTFLETVKFLYKTNDMWTTEDFLHFYFYTSGIPRYLKRIRANYNEEENIEEIFSKEEEYVDLFKSTFESKKSVHMNIVDLFENKQSLTSTEIVAIMKNKYNHSEPTSYSALKELVFCGFLKEIVNQKNKKEKKYFLIDLFCYSYLKLIKNKKNKKEHRKDIMFGYALEILALKNSNMILSEIKKEIEHQAFSWSNENAQIDLLIEYDPLDYAIIEVKNYNKVFEIDDNYAQNIKNKLIQFKEFKNKKNKKHIKTEIIFFTVYGTKRIQNKKDIIYKDVCINKIIQDFIKLSC